MTGITVADLVKATGGELTRGSLAQKISCVSLDSRSGLSPDGLFVPLIGARTDGHLYIKGAAENGAVAVLYSHDCAFLGEGLSWVRVVDTTRALQAFGRYLRERLDVFMVAITGSVGKTTTRELVALALSAGYPTFCAEKNFNSQVGVPVMMSRIPPEARVAVLEAGMSEFGEMAQLAPILSPDLTIITNIGVTHIENLKTRENIFQEKLLLAGAMKKGSPLVVNGDNDMLATLKPDCGYEVIRYGFGESCQVRAKRLWREAGRSCFEADCLGEAVTVSLRVEGEHMVQNALAALAAARLLGVPLSAAAEKLEEFTGYAGRQNIVEKDGITYFEDYYNASPDSMRAALRVLSGMSCEGRRIAILANMNELGEKTLLYHREIGQLAADCGLSQLICIGDLAREIAEGATEKDPSLSVHCFSSNAAATDYLEGIVAEGDLLLLKGSNSMRLGEISEQLKKKRG